MQKIDVSDTKIVTLTLAEIISILDLMNSALYDEPRLSRDYDSLEAVFNKLQKALN